MNTCHICQGNVQPWVTLKNAPLTSNYLYDTLVSSHEAPVEDMTFLYCHNCHFLFNPQFNPKAVRYDETYNNNQACSAVFNDALADKAERIIKTCSPTKVLEIGCGQGAFLSALKSHSSALQGKGYDPAFVQDNEQEIPIEQGVYRAQGKKQFDLCVLRFVLEQLENFDCFMSDVLQDLTTGGQIYIETPNLDHIMSNQLAHHLYHEAGCFYSSTGLMKRMAAFGFVVTDMQLLQNNEVLAMTFRSKPLEYSLPNYDLLLTQVSQAKMPVVWGAAGRSISLLHQLNLTTAQVRFVVDIDPNKQGKFIPHTGQKIISPREAIAEEVDLVIGTNKLYEQEIRASVSGGCKFTFI